MVTYSEGVSLIYIFLSKLEAHNEFLLDGGFVVHRVEIVDGEWGDSVNYLQLLELS